MDLELGGKRVLVTGGSKGIGRSIAETFLNEGARVAICARDPETLEASAEQLARLGEVHHRSADIGRPGDPEAFVEWAVDTLGGVDVLVSNASAMSNDFRQSVEVDIMGVQSLLTSGLRRMQEHAGANLVCISSRAASIGIPSLQSYSAVKAATISMVKSLAIHYAPRGIRANVVSPGDILFPGGSWQKVKDHNPKLWDIILSQNPMKRLGRPEEIAETVAFVASARASFISGANLLVDGAATPSLQI